MSGAEPAAVDLSPPPSILTLLMSHGASGLRTRHLQSRLLDVRRAANQAEGGAAESAPLLDYSKQLLRGRPHLAPSSSWRWLRRAPQDRAPSGSGGKRRAPGSWTRLVTSLEETKRKGARGHSGVTMPPHPSNPPLAAGPTKTLWCISSGALFPLLVLNQGGETSWVWPRRRVPRAQSRRCEDAETKVHCPDSSTWEKPSPVHPLNAGAPSSKLSVDDPTADPPPMAGQEDEGAGTDLQPQDSLTH